jgi:signal transduction histidine kinase
LPSLEFEQLIATPIADAIFLREGRDGVAVVLEPSGRLGRWEGAAVAAAFEQAFRLDALVSAPISAGDVRGRVFVAGSSRMSSEDLTIAGLVAEQIAAAFDRLAASAALRQGAASDERLRLARDLHDGVLQTLAGTALQLEEIAKQAGTDPRLVRDRIHALQEWLVGEQRAMRNFIRSLRPDGEAITSGADLQRSLAELCGNLEKQWGLHCRVDINPARLQAPELLSFQIHQIVREAAANAVRHGSATELEIAVRRSNGTINLSIADNGTGLPVSGCFDERACLDAQIGPRSLRERVIGLGGGLRLNSSEAGLRIEIDLPLPVVERFA